MSKTISITIPDQLERDLKKAAKKIGLSRSRFICNILLDWQKEADVEFNKCTFNLDGICTETGLACEVPQSQVPACAIYKEHFIKE